MPKPPDENGKEKPKKEPTPPKAVTPIYYNYPLDQVFKLRENLKMAVGEEFLGRAPTGSKFSRLVSLVQELLPGDIDYTVGSPHSTWNTGSPRGRWAVGAPAGRWAPGAPRSEPRPGRPHGDWEVGSSWK